MRPVTPEAARLRMAGLCARSEQSSYEVGAKLQRMGLSADDAASILSWLKEQRFVDDTRYARAYASDKLRFSRWGPVKIRAGLAAKRLPHDVVRQALEALPAEEISGAALEVALSKSRCLDLEMREDRRKLLAALAARGFTYDQSVEACRKVSAAR